MNSVAVVAHSGKTLGGGLLELRRTLEARGIADPQWYEVEKSKHAPKRVRQALENGAGLIFAWGGDGLVQRCVNVLAGTDTALAIVPAGTANLLASNLGIPKDIDTAVRIGLDGDRRRLDAGTINGEHFAVMAGAGFDARMIRDADHNLKNRLGRLSYVWTGAKNLSCKSFRARIRVDGAHWFRGDASCILVGNVGELFGGMQAFSGARPDDGVLELGVIKADGVIQWLRTIARTATGAPEESPFVRTTTAHSVSVKLNRKVLVELDGGARRKAKRLQIEVEPRAVEICVPATP